MENYLGYTNKIMKPKKDRKEIKLVIPSDISKCDREIIKLCSPFTMASVERQVALLNAVEYVSMSNITGCFVECGVWKGGSSLAAALKFSELGDYRDILMFDTFEGMTEPTEVDVDLHGEKAGKLLNAEHKNNDSSIWCVADLETVKDTMRLASHYPEKRIKLVKGKVEDTLKDNLPSSIAILRLDTDWYESTKYEMESLFPQLSAGGVLIIDDYGHWRGAKKAIDEYLKDNGIKILLNRVDYTGRVGVKIAISEISESDNKFE